MPQTTDVMSGLAVAMKYNPHLHVMRNGGYFALATPFFEGIYEMQHLPIPASLRTRTRSGHCTPTSRHAMPGREAGARVKRVARVRWAACGREPFFLNRVLLQL